MTLTAVDLITRNVSRLIQLLEARVLDSLVALQELQQAAR
jgi:hypothetical protein